MIYLLGLYQLSEFLLCKTDSGIWIRMGAIVFTIIPALGLHIAISLKSKIVDFKKLLIYIPAIIFSLIAILHNEFIISSSCDLLFVNIQIIFFKIPFVYIYAAYYFTYVVIATIIMLSKYYKEKDSLLKFKYLIFSLAVIFSLVPALLLIVILPSLGIVFPSIYCEFALVIPIFILIFLIVEKKKSK